jgi:hypothetical protein
MFTVHCPGHRARVLLGPRSIERLVNTDDGIALHWRCRCGSSGVVHRDGARAAVGSVVRPEQAA